MEVIRRCGRGTDPREGRHHLAHDDNVGGRPRRLRAAWTLVASLVLGVAVFLGGAGAAAKTPPAPPLVVYVGTYTEGGSRGIYRFEMDPASGKTTDPVLAGESENPSFLALHPGGRVLYAVNEVDSAGTVSAFAIDPVTGTLSGIGRQPSGGTDPCHLVVDKGGRNLLVANYGSGSVAVLPLDADGRPGPATSIRQHDGSGPNKARQAGPHAHAVLLDAAGRFALSADLGADRIFIDKFDATAGTLVANQPEAAELIPGSGPRHLAWSPTGKYLYVINELRSTMAVLRFDSDRGALDPIQTMTTLTPGFQGESTAAELAVSPDGRFLYATNRGDDSLALFSIQVGSGRLSDAGHFPTGGHTPRHFAIDPEGRWLLVANQDSNSIVVFRRDSASGRPTRAGRPITIPRPACIIFIPR